MDERMIDETNALFEEIKLFNKVYDEDLIYYFKSISKILNLTNIKEFKQHEFERKEIMATINQVDKIMRVDLEKIRRKASPYLYINNLDLTTSNKTNNYVLSMLYYFYHEVIHDYQFNNISSLNPVIQNSIKIKRLFSETYYDNHDLFPFEQDAVVRGNDMLYYVLNSKIALDKASLNSYFLRRIIGFYLDYNSIYEEFKNKYSTLILNDYNFEKAVKDLSIFDKIAIGLPYDKEVYNKILNICEYHDYSEDVPKILKKAINLDIK